MYGKKATTKASKKLDKYVKEIGEELGSKNIHFRFEKSINLTKHSGFGNRQRIMPDGGAFYVNEKLVAVIEAKKQGSRGNAIERWYKNNAWCRMIDNKVSYITICSGYVEDDGPLKGILYPVHNGDLGGFGRFIKGKNSAFFQKSWTKKELRVLIQGILDEINPLI